MAVLPVVTLLILLNFYMLGQRATIHTVKSAAGIWDADKYLPLIQAVVNLGLSIALVLSMGLIGVFIGTLAQGLLATVVRPLIVYPRVFQTPAREYFIDGAKYFLVLIVAGESSSLAVDAWLGSDQASAVELRSDLSQRPALSEVERRRTDFSRATANRASTSSQSI